MSSSSNNSTSKSNSSWLNAGVIIGVILIILLCFGVWGTCTESGKSTFANIKSKLSGGGSLRNLDIIMFMNPNCPWCKKMFAVLNSDIKNITVVDITKPDGVAMAQQFGADKKPVPSFISRKLRTGTVGFKKSIGELIEDLKLPPQSQPNSVPQNSSGEPGNDDGIKSLKIVLFTREGCSYCQKAKEECAKTGVIDSIQVIDITTPEGQQFAGQVLPQGISGVPVWISLTTKKHTVGYTPIGEIGYKPIGEIIQSLQ
jgi:glutaredoxin